MKREISNQKKIVTAIFVALIVVFALPAQEIKINSSKPKNKNAGRVVKTKPVLKIEDDPGKFFFRFPRNITVSPPGEIYLMDYNQFLRFDSAGKLMNNYFSLGSGPCELIAMRNYILHGNSIIVFNVRPHKIIWFDKTGSCTKEFRIYKNFFSGELLAFKDEKYYLVISGMPSINGNTGFAENPHTITEVSGDGKDLKSLLSFPVRNFVVQIPGGGRYNQAMCFFISRVHNDRFVFLSHTPEYLVKVVDLEKGDIAYSFSRPYDRVKLKKFSEEDITLGGKQYEELKQKYEEDIVNLFIFNSKVWVVTSTENSKGTLIDVFDFEGNYLDNFFLKVKGSIMAVDSQAIYTREKDKDENGLIVKYRLIIDN